MKRIGIVVCCFVVLWLPSQAQERSWILMEYMTLEEARESLERKVKNIECCLDSAFQEQGKEIKEYPYNYTRPSGKTMGLLSKEEVVSLLSDPRRKSLFTFSNQGRKSWVNIKHNTGYLIGYVIRTYLSDQTKIKKVFYANGTTETDPTILETKLWYYNLKPIDSLLVDINIHYPTAMDVVKMPIDEPQRKEIDKSRFVELIDKEENRVTVAFAEGMLRKGELYFRSGERLYSLSKSGHMATLPTLEMYTTLRELYNHCLDLIDKIDKGYFSSMEKLMEEHKRTRPAAPTLQYIHTFVCEIPADTESLEFYYVSSTDSMLFTDKIVKLEKERMCDYGIYYQNRNYGLVDLDGNIIVEPSTENGSFQEVVGVFFTPKNNDRNKKNFRLLTPDLKMNKMERTPYESYEIVNNTYLLVKEDEKGWGVLHRNGDVILPTNYESITYTDDRNSFIAKLPNGFYQLFNTKGNLIFPDAYHAIEIKNGNIYLSYPVIETGKNKRKR